MRKTLPAIVIALMVAVCVTEAQATMPVLTKMPTQPTKEACLEWAHEQDEDAIDMWGTQTDGSSNRESAISRLTLNCLGEKAPEIVGFYSSAGAAEEYCKAHSIEELCLELSENSTESSDINSTEAQVRTAQTQQDESPLQCQLSDQLVSCDVVQDNITITDVVLNRGRCESSLPNENDKSILEDFIATLPENERSILPLLMPQLAQMAAITQCNTDTSDCPKKTCLGTLAYLRLNNDPRGEHHFGDKFSFLTVGCSNLLEYTIDVGDTAWTWKTR